MKVLIINHCAHNKGDNSVLYFLSKKLSLQKKINEIYLSSSDGQIPFWSSKKLFKKVCFWGQGKAFNEKNFKFLNIFFLKIKNLIYKKFIFKIIIYLFSIKKDAINKIIFKLVYNRSFLNLLSKSDIVISTGGHHISPELDKNSVNVQLTDMISSVIFKKKIVLWSQSIGKIDYNQKYIIRAIRRLIRESAFVFPRDDSSIDFIKKIGAFNKSRIFKCPDSVFGIKKINRTSIKKKKLALIAIYTAKKRSLADEIKYSNFFSEVLKHLNTKKFKIVLLPMQYKGLPGDERQVLKKIISNSQIKDVKIIDKDVSPKNTIKLFNNSNLIIAHKTHAIFYGLSLSIPTLGIFYHQKIKNIMETYNLKKYAVDDKTLNKKNVIKLIDNLITNERYIKKTIFKKSITISKIVNDNFRIFLKNINKF